MKLQQGDVLVKKVSAIPKTAKKVERKNGRYVIAEGEATGHTHAIYEEIGLYEEGGVLYAKNDKAVQIKHEEHGAIVLEPGLWKFGTVKEYDPFLEETRQVID